VRGGWHRGPADSDRDFVGSFVTDLWSAVVPFKRKEQRVQEPQPAPIYAGVEPRPYTKSVPAGTLISLKQLFDQRVLHAGQRGDYDSPHLLAHA
jgi:hypothetical protein